MWASAELATGVIVICLPILPGIRHRRKLRSDAYATHDSTHARQRGSKLQLGPEAALDTGFDFHLSGKPGGSRETMPLRPDPVIINEIKGGNDSSDTPLWSQYGGSQEPETGQIFKMTRIEQTG